MNRRSFLKSLGTVATGFAILPAATTYKRIWKPNQSGLFLPNSNDGLFGLLNTDMVWMYNIASLKDRLALYRISNNGREPFAFSTNARSQFVEIPTHLIK